MQEVREAGCLSSVHKYSLCGVKLRAGHHNLPPALGGATETLLGGVGSWVVHTFSPAPQEKVGRGSPQEVCWYQSVHFDLCVTGQSMCVWCVLYLLPLSQLLPHVPLGGFHTAQGVLSGSRAF